MKKSLFTAFAVGLGLTASLFAQVPSYVPTNGLVGWWPFNGNANDESGNLNNGTVNGATLTTDRFGNADKAYSFSSNNNTSISTNIGVVNGSFSIIGWYKASTPTSKYPRIFYLGDYPFNMTNNNFNMISAGIMGNEPSWIGVYTGRFYYESNIINNSFNHSVITSDNLWHFFAIIYDSQSNLSKLFIDGQLIISTSFGINSINSGNLYLGRDPGDFYGGCSGCGRYSGVIDDFGIWNRTLSNCEIQDLYNSQINSVAGSIAVSPQLAPTGSNVSLTTATNSTNLQWQSNPSNYGWQNVPSNLTYSGGTSNTLTVNNVQLANHNQPFRVIASNGNCTDTSNIATIQIADTCITNVTVYDTLLTTVTDTLIINTTLSLPAPNNENTILIYPNPASDHITIDNGNFAAMAGYSIKIENNAGQQVFQSAINQAQFYVDLSTWTGNGLYFVHLIDPQNNTVTVRKIVLQ